MTPEELALESLQAHVASGKRVILATRFPMEVGDIAMSFLWSYEGLNTTRIHQPCRMVEEVSFEVFRAEQPPFSMGWETGPGDCHFYVFESD